MKLSKAQLNLLFDVKDGGVHRYNGRMGKTIQRLGELGLVAAEYEALIHAVGKATDRWTVVISDAGRARVAERAGCAGRQKEKS